MYYKISTITEKPLLQFDLVANSLDELNSLGLVQSSPFIIVDSAMETLTVLNGIFTKELNDKGVLVDRNTETMASVASEYKATAKSILREKLQIKSNEINLAERLEESTTSLLTEFETLKSEYEAIVIT